MHSMFKIYLHNFNDVLVRGLWGPFQKFQLVKQFLVDLKLCFGSLSGCRRQLSAPVFPDCHICFQNLLIVIGFHSSICLYNVSCATGYNATIGKLSSQGVLFITFCSFSLKYRWWLWPKSYIYFFTSSVHSTCFQNASGLTISGFAYFRRSRLWWGCR